MNPWEEAKEDGRSITEANWYDRDAAAAALSLLFGRSCVSEV
jgi:hypothetical protein